MKQRPSTTPTSSPHEQSRPALRFPSGTRTADRCGETLNRPPRQSGHPIPQPRSREGRPKKESPPSELSHEARPAMSRILLAIRFLLVLASAHADDFFATKVEPILRQRCFECHSHAGNIKGGLVLDSRSGWQTGGDSGPAVIPGNPEKSPLVRAVRYTDPDMEMPPKGKLPPSEIAVLEEWVKRGAVDPRETATPTKVATRAGIDIDAGRKHWAYQPVKSSAPPNIQDRHWPLTEIDPFILHRLENAHLQPNADADPHTWLRRVSLDLTGLPPTQPEIEDFIADLKSTHSKMASLNDKTRPTPHERVVDRLLASPAFGERWARHWLDLVGYAEQIGTEGKIFAEHAWRYRDYLVQSFNDDKPFDQFIREQLAGDLLPANSPEQRRKNLIATGFIVLGDVDINAIDKRKMEHDFIDGQVSKVGTDFLGW